MESRIMTQQDKDLLLRDLCARLPYDVKIDYKGKLYILRIRYLEDARNIAIGHEYSRGYDIRNVIIKPYLRPLSSLTQEERDKFCDIGGVISYRPDDGKQYIVAFVPEALDYLNSIHADYRGLIEKGLAIEVTNDNNPYK